jgi:hypothetical protein
MRPRWEQGPKKINKFTSLIFMNLKVAVDNKEYMHTTCLYVVSCIT